MPSNNQYIFGNSLVNFAGGDAYSNVPRWMDAFAEASGDTYAFNGGFGFLREYADRAEPASQWGFEGVDTAWDDQSQSFAEAQFDSVLITPANFIQDLAPDANYFGDVRSPLDAVLDVVADVGTAQPGATILIYQGWADMAPFSEETPAPAGAVSDYHAYNMGAYSDWFDSLVAQVNAADPDANVQLLPVASILSELFTTVLADVPAGDLYADSAPHGTETTYFLASMVVYQGTYGTAPTLPAALPTDIHPSVLANFDLINSEISNSLADAGFAVAGGDAAVPAPADGDQVDPVPEDTSDTTVDPAPVVPAPVDPAPVDPAPVDPAPVDPEPVDTGEGLPDGEDETPTTDDGAGRDVVFELPYLGTRLPDLALDASRGEGRDDSDAEPAVGRAHGLKSDTGTDIRFGMGGGHSFVPITSVDPDVDEVAMEAPDATEDLETDAEQQAPTGIAVTQSPVGSQAVPLETDNDGGFSARYFDLGEGEHSLATVVFFGDADHTAQVDSLDIREEAGALYEGGAEDFVAAQFHKAMVVTEAGVYRFDLTADDEAAISIDGETVLETRGSAESTPDTVEVEMEPGTYTVTVDYLELRGEATLDLNVYQMEAPVEDDDIYAAGKSLEDLAIEQEAREANDSDDKDEDEAFFSI